MISIASSADLATVMNTTGNPGVDRMDCAEHLEPGRVGEPEVEEDGVGRLEPDSFNPLGPARRVVHAVLRIGKGVPDLLWYDVQIVINQEDVSHGVEAPCLGIFDYSLPISRPFKRPLSMFPGSCTGRGKLAAGSPMCARRDASNQESPYVEGDEGRGELARSRDAVDGTAYPAVDLTTGEASAPDEWDDSDRQPIGDLRPELRGTGIVDPPRRPAWARSVLA